MTTWIEFETDVAQLAAAVKARFTDNKHHVLATLRADGSPRVSGTEVEFTAAGEVRLGSMSKAMKVIDLQRDSRFALHSNPGHHSMVGGDAKLSGRAIEITDAAALQKVFDAAPPELVPYNVFDLDITEVVLTSIVDDRMKIELWRPGQPVRTFTR